MILQSLPWKLAAGGLATAFCDKLYNDAPLIAVGFGAVVLLSLSTKQIKALLNRQRQPSPNTPAGP